MENKNTWGENRECPLITQKKHNKESYGRLYGYFVGPLAVKKLLVNLEDYEKASLLMKEYRESGLGTKKKAERRKWKGLLLTKLCCNILKVKSLN